MAGKNHSSGEPGEKERPGRSQASCCVDLALEHSRELFHDGERAFATITISGNVQTHALPSTPIRRWLADLYYRERGAAASNESVAAALNALAGRAFFRGKEAAVYLRAGEHCGKTYIDLGDGTWRVVEVRPTGWRIIEARNAPVKFRRTRAMRALPEPQSGGSLEQLKEFINLPDEPEFLLVVGWMVAAIRCRGPFPGFADTCQCRWGENHNRPRVEIIDRSQCSDGPR